MTYNNLTEYYSFRFLDFLLFSKICKSKAKRLNIKYIHTRGRIFVDINNKKVGVYSYRDFNRLLSSCLKFESKDEFLVSINVR